MAEHNDAQIRPEAISEIDRKDWHALNTRPGARRRAIEVWKKTLGLVQIETRAKLGRQREFVARFDL